MRLMGQKIRIRDLLADAVGVFAVFAVPYGLAVLAQALAVR